MSSIDTGRPIRKKHNFYFLFCSNNETSHKYLRFLRFYTIHTGSQVRSFLEERGEPQPKM